MVLQSPATDRNACKERPPPEFTEGSLLHEGARDLASREKVEL